MGSFFGPFVGADAVRITDATPFAAPQSSPRATGVLIRSNAADRSSNIQARRGGCLGELLSNIQFRQAVVNADGSTSPFVDSPKVRDGYWWYVLAASLHSQTTGASADMGIFLMPPEASGNSTASLGDFESSGGIEIANETYVGGTGPASRTSTEVNRPFALPPNWFIRGQFFFATGNPVAGAPLILRLAYAETPADFDALEILG